MRGYRSRAGGAGCRRADATRVHRAGRGAGAAPLGPRTVSGGAGRRLRRRACDAAWEYCRHSPRKDCTLTTPAAAHHRSRREPVVPMARLAGHRANGRACRTPFARCACWGCRDSRTMRRYARHVRSIATLCMRASRRLACRGAGGIASHAPTADRGVRAGTGMQSLAAGSTPAGQGGGPSTGHPALARSPNSLQIVESVAPGSSG